MAQRKLPHTQGADGHRWKKYGHKFISGTTIKRTYYACARRDSLGCKARKIVDVRREDKTRDAVVYLEGEHNHTASLSASLSVGPEVAKDTSPAVDLTRSHSERWSRPHHNTPPAKRVCLQPAVGAPVAKQERVEGTGAEGASPGLPLVCRDDKPSLTASTGGSSFLETTDVDQGRSAPGCVSSATQATVKSESTCAASWALSIDEHTSGVPQVPASHESIGGVPQKPVSLVREDEGCKRSGAILRFPSFALYTLDSLLTSADEVSNSADTFETHSASANTDEAATPTTPGVVSAFTSLAINGSPGAELSGSEAAMPLSQSRPSWSCEAASSIQHPENVDTASMTSREHGDCLRSMHLWCTVPEAAWPMTGSQEDSGAVWAHHWCSAGETQSAVTTQSAGPVLQGTGSCASSFSQGGQPSQTGQTGQSGVSGQRSDFLREMDSWVLPWEEEGRESLEDLGRLQEIDSPEQLL